MESEDQQSIFDHLTELRRRLSWSLFFIFLGFLVSWGFSEIIFDFVRAPISPYLNSSGGGLIFTAPMDKFIAHIKVSLLSGVIIASPLWIYQIWMFVSPGLYSNEKKYGIGFMCFGTALFLSGVTFVYSVVFPMAFKFLMAFGGDMDKGFITIDRYLSFFITTTLVFGLAFELPLILTILGMVGVINDQFLIEKRRYALVLLAALSAMFTPPDVISMFAMMVPMILLYELSIILVKFFQPKQQTY